MYKKIHLFVFVFISQIILIGQPKFSHFNNAKILDQFANRAKIGSTNFKSPVTKTQNILTQYWAKSIGGANAAAINNIIALDGSGNIYITGSFNGTVDFDPGSGTQNLTSVGRSDIFFAKYNANGNYVFAKSIGGTASTIYSTSMAVDGSGNVYLTGNFDKTVDFDPGSTTQNLISDTADVFFAKYNANGNYVFAKRIGGTGMVDNEVLNSSIALDGSKNIYLSGSFMGTIDFDPESGTQNLFGFGDTFFAKYDTSGNYVFAKKIGETSAQIGRAINFSMALDGSGNIYLSGSFMGTIDFDPGSGAQNLTSTGQVDTYFAKYDANGNYIFAKNIGGTTAMLLFSSLALDGSGSIYITGSFGGTADFDPGSGTQNLTSLGQLDIFFAKYDAGGNYLFAKSIVGTDTMTLIFSSSLSVDGSGNIFITGSFGGTADFDPGSGTQNLTAAGLSVYYAKYSANGNYIFAKSLSGANSAVFNIPIDYFGQEGGLFLGYITKSLGLDVSGNIYLTGFFMGGADFDPESTTKYLVAVGKMDIFFAKYNSDGNLTKVENENAKIPSTYSLSQNYPNPFNPTTTIRFGLPSEANVKLEIYNSLGQIVETLVDEKLTASCYEVNWNAKNIPSGLYFYKLTTVDINDTKNKFIQTKKMMLVK